MEDSWACLERERAGNPRYPPVVIGGTGPGAGEFPPRALRIIRAIASRLFDPGNGLAAERLDRFVADVQDWGRYAGPKTRLALRGAATAVQWTPILTMRRLARFTSLAPSDQVSHLERMERSRIALFVEAFAGLKTVLSILWYDDATDESLPAVVRSDRKPMDTMRVVP